MNESTLSKILQKVSDTPRNNYDANITQDLLEVTKRELAELNIKFEPYIFKQKERLKIFYTDNDYIKYSKNFYPNNSMFGFKISNDKMLTEKCLKLANVSTTNSLELSYNEYDKGEAFINSTSSPKVEKPLNLANGRGVFLNVTKDDFEDIWRRCISIQKQRKIKNPKVLIQDMIKGFEVRVVIVEGKILSATLRTPAYVVGDGETTISGLIDQKNKIRELNGYFKSKKLKKNDDVIKYLSGKDLSLDTVLKKDELCITYPISNLINGGENIVITKLLNSKVLEIARDAVAAIPGLHTAGVDVMIENLESENPKILEVNKAPALQLNYYPYIGEPQSPLKYIFSSLVLEKKILDDQITFNDLNENDFEILKERYKFLHKKQVSLSNIIENITK